MTGADTDAHGDLLQPGARGTDSSARLAVLARTESSEYSRQEILSLALDQAVAGTGALGGLAYLAVHGDRCCLQLAASTGLPAQIIDAHRTLDDRDAPARAAATCEVSWTALHESAEGASGILAAPLPDNDGTGRTMGVLAVLTIQVEQPSAQQRSFLQSVAAWAASRVSKCRDATASALRPAVREDSNEPPGAQQALYMGELTASLASAATSRDVTQALADHLLPPFDADGLVVYALEGGRMKLVGAAGYDEDFLKRYDNVPLSSVASHSQVMRTRTPFFPETAAEFSCRFPGEQEIAEASHQQAWAFLPLVAADRPIGCCVVAYIRPHHFTFADRALLIALSGLVAHALERARLYDSAHRRAQELQHGLLPGAPPHLAFADLAVRYRSDTRHAEVGGDWYDAIPLSAGRFALVVGDVMGHGIAEAATMGRIRTAVRTLAELELTPAEVLTQVNALVAEFGDGKYAGCLYIVVDPVSRRCSICRAGHLPALIVFPDGTVRPLSAEANPPLGVGEPPLETSEVQLPEESLFALYTNGLIDTARSDVDQGLVRLEGVLREEVMRRGFPGLGTGASRQPLTELCQAVMDAMLPDPEQMTDDAALVIAHVHGTPTDDVGSRSLKQDATAAREARGYAHEQLTEWGLEELIDETELIVSELVGNAIKYATGPIRLRLIRSDSLICEVYDGSLTTPHIRRAADTDEGGRGLQLVAALSERWGARYLDDGKCIWAEQGLNSRV